MASAGCRLGWLLISLTAAFGLLLGVHAGPGLLPSDLVAGSVIISEVAWSGTAAAGSHEWIELQNNTKEDVDLSGWHLIIRDSDTIDLNGSISAGSFFLLERKWEDVISDINADQIYNVEIVDSGQSIELLNGTGTLIDSANHAGGPWPAGSGSPDFSSMERRYPFSPDTAEGWVSNNGTIRNGLDFFGEPINGTPRRPNSSWTEPGSQPDLVADKQGEPILYSGGETDYTLTLEASAFTATAVLMTDTLPQGFYFIGDNSGYPVSEARPGEIVWQIGDIPSGTLITINARVGIQAEVEGIVTNTVMATSRADEIDIGNNQAQFSSIVKNTPPMPILIDAVLVDGIAYQDADEAVRLFNISDELIDISGWGLSDGISSLILPSEVALAPGRGIWLVRQAKAFQSQFGYSPDFEAPNNEDDPGVRNALGAWPNLANSGDQVLLRDEAGLLQDVLVYGDGNNSQSGWLGPSLLPFKISTKLGAEGQILYRMRDQASGMPIVDSDRALDWAQSPGDVINGRKVRYPGWDLDKFFFGLTMTETATLKVGIAPDNAYLMMAELIGGAQNDLKIVTHTFRSQAIADLLIAAAGRGVSVTVLLEGGPSGGLDDQERLACQRLEDGGGQCWFMIRDDEQHIQDRYFYLHAKYMIVDDRLVVISSENLSPDSMPDDDKSDGTWGRRGVMLVTDAPGVIGRVQAIWQADFDPLLHHDLLRWSADDPTYGKPPPGTVPLTDTGGTGYDLRFTEPGQFYGTYAFEVVSSPENSLRNFDNLLGLINRAAAGDTLLVQQLNEPLHWGTSESDPVSDPNPRLEAYLAAARRGTVVRILLDGYFPDSRVTNGETCAYVKLIANKEMLDLRCAMVNSTGLGIHNKMVLARINGRGYVHAGSLNGSELSNKGNRELALQVQSDEAYELLADMFYGDWLYKINLPLIYQSHTGRAWHILISEILYYPDETPAAEFIELVNPTPFPIQLDGFALADAVLPTDFEDQRFFPANTVVGPGNTIVVALAATTHKTIYGRNPDFEIWNSDQTVADLIDDLSWGNPAAILQLGNSGDELLLKNSFGEVIDSLAYGSGHLDGMMPCPLVTVPGRSLERYPYWRDTNNCPADFRMWPFPNPGTLP